MARFLDRMLALAVALTVALSPVAAADSSRRYANPVSAPAADTFADPAVIRGKDGFWYAFGTGDPLRRGEHVHRLLPIMRSADLTRWEYVTDVFTQATRPRWAAHGAGLWAPDIRYVDGRYLLYFTVTDTVLNEGGDAAVGGATAPSPTGPWTALDAPVVPPVPGDQGRFWSILDPAMLTDTAGKRWLYYGSYYGGLFVVPLSDDGTRKTGAATRIAIGDRYEGAYAVRRNGWYYLFASSANCCVGPATGYSVFAGRSRSPTGPFTDRDGISLLDSRTGGTPVVQQHGNRWIGTGHNSVATDAAGQDWLLYHGIDRSDPYLDEPHGVNMRPMLLDRLDWIDDWPTVRAGAGASTGRQRAPVTSGVVDDRFERGVLGPGWRASSPGWRLESGALRHASTGTNRLTSAESLPANAFVELDVRVDGAAGVSFGGTTVMLDRRAAALVTDVPGRGVRLTPLPPHFRYSAWHSLTVRLRGGELTASVTDARLGDPVAEQSRDFPFHTEEFALIARGTAEFDNVSLAHAAQPVRRSSPVPHIGRLDRTASDEFDGALSSGWTWVRGDPAATVHGGSLRWPAQAADLVGTNNTAGILLRDPPRGDYVVETRLDLDLGEGTVRNFQQAGLIAYADDDDFARLSHVAIWNTRQLEFGRELPHAGRLVYGQLTLTAPAPRIWLRLAHSVDPVSGEHRFRGGASRDGEHWTWGGTWTFPAGPAPRIGLVSHGGDSPPVTATFAYFRVYRG
ncbi:family 43 glycosylhydrolase [Allokutzneria sp. A3M-2-11 16]|uniref:family 43 glycosylhydrolase n=1 Tax=Allokutzneria sp. A3M-2-11 16 TaxID=2962043 RepID=UPI0020B65D05|nr:family 43 glycosylhydrolase [Allokutzneria sp. A3M-2-11 16]MCP3802368.1 family 43 glycosylhydrolase [Allokutzneria sp. A3M-2-11 16]